jgi:hypothetical protein
MRYSSMKSIFATLSIVVTLLAAVPAANAAAAQAPRATKSSSARDEGPAGDRFAAVRRFVNRAVRRLASHTGITIPHPEPEPTTPE